MKKILLTKKNYKSLRATKCMEILSGNLLRIIGVQIIGISLCKPLINCFHLTLEHQNEKKIKIKRNKYKLEFFL